MKTLLLTVVAVLALLIYPAVIRLQANTGVVIAYLPGHYLAPFGGVVYTHTQPATVAQTESGLVWTITIFDTAGVYQGSFFVPWGVNTDIPLDARDYDGDGYDDLAVFRPSNQTTYVRRSACPAGWWSCTYVLVAP